MRTRPYAHLSSWKLATPRWRNPTAMQVSFVTAWSNAWNQHAQGCKAQNPVPPMDMGFHWPRAASRPLPPLPRTLGLPSPPTAD